jgi:tetratricopeptide (TPR) repeat protein
VQSIPEHIGKILTDFFSSDILFDLNQLLRTQYNGTDTPENYLPVSRDNYSAVIDDIIVFAEGKLTNSKLVELLFHFGEYSISLGAVETSTELYRKIISASSDRPELQNIKAYSYLSLGDIYSRQAEWQKSIRYLTKAKKLFDQQKDFRGSARCENILGTIYGDRGNIKKAKLHFEKSLGFLDQKQDEYLIGMIETNLGIINNIQGNYDQAFTFHRRAIFKFEQMQDFRRLAEVRNNLGMMYSQKGEFNLALNMYDQSIEVSLKSGYLPTLVVSYLSKSYIYTQLQDYNMAQAFSDKAMDGALKLNDRLSVADIYKIKGIIEKILLNYDAAEDYFRKSIRINLEVENILNLAESTFELGMMYNELSKKKEAIEQLTISLENYRKLDAHVMSERLEKIIESIQ